MSSSKSKISSPLSTSNRSNSLPEVDGNYDGNDDDGNDDNNDDDNDDDDDNLSYNKMCYKIYSLNTRIMQTSQYGIKKINIYIYTHMYMSTNLASSYLGARSGPVPYRIYHIRYS
jgi:hypothetical protein